MRYDRTVIAYHGCDSKVARRILAGESFEASENDYDWLGHGVYFWEYGANRALKFAEEQRTRRRIKTPAYVGALIQLGNCFDLMDTRFTADLADAYVPWAKGIRSKRLPLPKNDGRAPDHKLRRLDCAVLNWYLDRAEKEGLKYDTVRCGFSEGKRIYPHSGIFEQSHIQLAVRNPSCILGVFRPIVEEL